MKPKKLKKVVGWAGIVNGKIDIVKEVYSNRDLLAIYPRKKIADNLYECVQKVSIQAEERTPR